MIANKDRLHFAAFAFHLGISNRTTAFLTKVIALK